MCDVQLGLKKILHYWRIQCSTALFNFVLEVDEVQFYMWCITAADTCPFPSMASKLWLIVPDPSSTVLPQSDRQTWVQEGDLSWTAEAAAASKKWGGSILHGFTNLILHTSTPPTQSGRGEPPCSPLPSLNCVQQPASSLGSLSTWHVQKRNQQVLLSQRHSLCHLHSQALTLSRIQTHLPWAAILYWVLRVGPGCETRLRYAGAGPETQPDLWHSIGYCAFWNTWSVSLPSTLIKSVKASNTACQLNCHWELLPNTIIAYSLPAVNQHMCDCVQSLILYGKVGRGFPVTLLTVPSQFDNISTSTQSTSVQLASINCQRTALHVVI